MLLLVFLNFVYRSSVFSLRRSVPSSLKSPTYILAGARRIVQE